MQRQAPSHSQVSASKWLHPRLEHTTHAANDDQPRDRDVDRIVARIHATRARTEAVRLNRMGEFSGARRALRGVARRIADSPGSDGELRELAGQLVARESAVSTPMKELDRTRVHFTSANLRRSRSMDGQSATLGQTGRRHH